MIAILVAVAALQGEGEVAITVEKLKVAEVEREYRLVVPKSADPAKPAPLVFAFHGLGGGMDTMPLQTRLDDLAAKQGFLLVYPQGLEKRWQLRVDDNRDLPFFDALLGHLVKVRKVDPDRVYATGMSNGGYFSMLLASQRSEVLAAVAPHSGGLGVLAARGIGAKRKLPLMIIHGDEDGVVPVAEGRAARDTFKKEGHEVEYVELEGHGHLWAGKKGINEKIGEFFRKHPRK